MKVYIESALSEHRRGRFLLSVLDAEVLNDSLPDDGIVIMTGKDYQGFDTKNKSIYKKWCAKPGRTLLLVPPYEQGVVDESIDWSVEYITNSVAENGVTIPDKVASEVSVHLLGKEGEFDRTAGHQWPDYSINTRFYKQHSGTGMFAATTLPLWSIALMEAGKELSDWLDNLHSRAGQATNESNDMEGESDKQISLLPIEYSVLLCIYVFGRSNPDELFNAVTSQPVSIINITQDELMKALGTLDSNNLITENGLSKTGEHLLQSSPYWAYAMTMREEVA